MWNTFIPDLTVAAIGSALTVAIALITFLVGRHRRQVEALRGLIYEIHHRRAVTLVNDPRSVWRASRRDDYARVNSSIIDIRRQIRRASDALRPGAEAQRPLSKMVRACNRYLENSASKPNLYLFYLVALRGELSNNIHTIAGLHRSVHALEPGEGAL